MLSAGPRRVTPRVTRVLFLAVDLPRPEVATHDHIGRVDVRGRTCRRAWRDGGS
ncbi:hypothetical protein DVA67_030470 [Solirubrobacter sp. CPCC 204708]|nr:hypothetical protein [Solirubrobacter deserti]